MSDWIGLGIFVLVVVLAVVASSQLGKPPKRITVEEFEKRARSGAFTRAGMFALQQILNPKAAKSIEVQQDLRHGYYNKKRVPGEGDEEEELDDAADANVGRVGDVDGSGGKASEEVLSKAMDEDLNAKGSE
jgi:hypothetical protein